MKRRRIDGGLSQSQLAERVKTSQAYISKMERGDVNWTLGTIEAVALALGQDTRAFILEALSEGSGDRLREEYWHVSMSIQEKVIKAASARVGILSSVVAAVLYEAVIRAIRTTDLSMRFVEMELHRQLGITAHCQNEKSKQIHEELYRSALVEADHLMDAVQIAARQAVRDAVKRIPKLREPPMR
jgi:transcriptional regulator with XRE-family HTH domain